MYGRHHGRPCLLRKANVKRVNARSRGLTTAAACARSCEDGAKLAVFGSHIISRPLLFARLCNDELAPLSFISSSSYLLVQVPELP